MDGKGEGDLVTVGVVPVQGRFEERALVLVRVGAVDASVAVEGALRALAPRDALVVVRLDVSVLDVDGRGRGRGGFGGRGCLEALDPVVADDGQDDRDDCEDRDGCGRD